MGFHNVARNSVIGFLGDVYTLACLKNGAALKNEVKHECDLGLSPEDVVESFGTTQTPYGFHCIEFFADDAPFSVRFTVKDDGDLSLNMKSRGDILCEDMNIPLEVLEDKNQLASFVSSCFRDLSETQDAPVKKQSPARPKLSN